MADPFRIMVVDDCADFRAGLENSLRQIDCVKVDIQMARDGIEALRILQDQPPHVVVTDTNMPRLNGIELLRFLKFHHRSTKVVVLFDGLEGTSISADDVKGMGADLVLKKTEIKNRLFPYLHNKTVAWWLYSQMHRIWGRRSSPPSS